MVAIVVEIGGVVVTVGESRNISRAHTGQTTYLGHENVSDNLLAIDRGSADAVLE